MASTTTQATSKRIPPYLPFKTFLNSLDTLSQGVPPKLDRTFWKNQSGINQGLIMNAYRFFLLVDQNDASTDILVSLAQHPDERAIKIGELLIDQYLVILEKIDITKSTLRMLEEAFGEVYPITGATKQKAITFFLKAAKYADMPLSPYLLAQLRESAKKPRRPKQRNEEEEHVFPTNRPSANYNSHSVQLVSGGRLTISITANPFTMPPEDRNFFFSVVDTLQKYKEQHPEVQQEETEEEE